MEGLAVRPTETASAWGSMAPRAFLPLALRSPLLRPRISGGKPEYTRRPWRGRCGVNGRRALCPHGRPSPRQLLFWQEQPYDGGVWPRAPGRVPEGHAQDLPGSVAPAAAAVRAPTRKLMTHSRRAHRHLCVVPARPGGPLLYQQVEGVRAGVVPEECADGFCSLRKRGNRDGEARRR